MTERLKRAIMEAIAEGLDWEATPRRIARAIVQEYGLDGEVAHTLIGLGEVVAYECVRDLLALAEEEGKPSPKYKVGSDLLREAIIQDLAGYMTFSDAVQATDRILRALAKEENE